MKNINDKYLRVGGLVKEGTLKFEENVWVFEVIDENKQTIKVKYSKTLPNLVEEKKGIIVEGKINKNNLFIAEIVLAKHDENYMPQSAIDKMRNDGIWRGN
jgi:cytochrome c-type biogenesis protein CcmE